jgi:hypothetical protein
MGEMTPNRPCGVSHLRFLYGLILTVYAGAYNIGIYPQNFLVQMKYDKKFHHFLSYYHARRENFHGEGMREYVCLRIGRFTSTPKLSAPAQAPVPFLIETVHSTSAVSFER